MFKINGKQDYQFHAVVLCFYFISCGFAQSEGGEREEGDCDFTI